MASASLPVGPSTPPAVQLVRWMGRTLPFFHECSRRYGDRFTLRLAGFPPIVMFSDGEAIKDIFTGDPEVMRAGVANVALRPVLGESSLLLLDGARHLRERKLMMPPFHGERMRAYGDAMIAEADRAIDRWPLGRPFRIHPEMQAITLDVILRTVFGLEQPGRLDEMRDRITTYTTVGSSMIGTALLMTSSQGFSEKLTQLAEQPLSAGPIKLDVARFLPWTKIVRAGRAVERMLYDELDARRAAGGAAREDVLSLLLAARDEQGRAMTDVELRDEMMTLVLAGHETSATTLAWAVRHVLANPTAYRALADELGDAPVTAERAATLPYLDAVIKETLRLTPIVAVVMRYLAQPARVGGVDLPAGVTVAANIYLAHRRPDAWPEPDAFRPERFVGKKIDPYQYFPFGGGTRRCLGMAFASYEMKLVLARVLSRTTLRLAAPRDLKMVRRGITFAPEGGVRVVALSRR